MTLGCAVLVALSLILATWVHRELAPAGSAVHTTRSLLILWILSGCAVLTAILTLIFVLRPVQQLAKDIRRIAQGDLAHRTELGRPGQMVDSFGEIANEMNRLAVRLRELRETESGRLQMEFQLSDAVLQAIFEPVIVTDSKGHVLKINQAAAEVLGDAAKDRMALINMTNTPGGDKIMEAIRNAVSMQRAIAHEDEAALLPMRFGNRERSYRLRTTPMRDSDGRLLGAVTTLEDVTSLQDTDRFKTQFIAIASQKLRDPLLQLRRALYALGKGFAGELRPLQTELVVAAGQEAEKLNDLMADLIEVSELDSGKREPHLERLRPYALLVEAHDQAVDDAAHCGIRIEIDAFADLSFIQADHRAVRTIFGNLVTNALRYTPAGGEVILAAEERKGFVQFTVRDTGKGIAAERLSSIFDRFSALSDSGTGLGLALVRRLVESQGGQISVESRLGSGSTFRFTIPVATVEISRHPVEVG